MQTLFPAPLSPTILALPPLSDSPNFPQLFGQVLIPPPLGSSHYRDCLIVILPELQEFVICCLPLQFLVPILVDLFLFFSFPDRIIHSVPIYHHPFDRVNLVVTFHLHQQAPMVRQELNLTDQQLNTKSPALKLNSTDFNRFFARVEPFEARRGDGQNDINLVIG